MTSKTNSYIAELTYEDYLAHYGIKGMKWGVRKAEKKAKREVKRQAKSKKIKKKAADADARINDINNQMQALPPGIRSSLKRASLKSDKKELTVYRDQLLKDADRAAKGKLTSNQRKLVAGAVVAGALAGGVALSSMHDSGSLNAMMLKGEKIIKRKDSVFNKNDEFSKKFDNADDLLKTVGKDVNPNYASLGGQMNCRRCTFAYELRRRGYDVQATTSPIGTGQSESGYLNAVNQKEKKRYAATSMSQPVSRGRKIATPLDGDKRLRNVESARLSVAKNKGEPIKSSQISKLLGNQPNGARGEIVFNQGKFAHSLAYEIVNNKPYAFDTQKGQKFDLSKHGFAQFQAKWGDTQEVSITRLDNVDLDESFLARWATNRK